MILTSASRTATGGIAVLIVESVGNANLIVVKRTRVNDNISVGNALQSFLNAGVGCIAIECDGECACALSISSNSGTRKHNIAAGGSHGGEVSSAAELIIKACAAGTNHG